MTSNRGALGPKKLIGKSDHRATHVWDGDECRWCAVRRSWPGAAMRCRGGAVANQDAARSRVAKSIAKTKAARAGETT